MGEHSQSVAQSWKNETQYTLSRAALVPSPSHQGLSEEVPNGIWGIHLPRVARAVALDETLNSPLHSR